MSTRALEAVLFREAKIRATNWTFIFWDLLYPLGYLLVFGLGMNASLGFTSELNGLDYNAFFLAGVLGMASFGIASNTSWSFFLDRDNGIFYEMLTYPLSRSQYLVGKVLFNVGVALVQALLTVGLSGLLLGVQVRPSGLPLLVAATVIGTRPGSFSTRSSRCASGETIRSTPSRRCSISCSCSRARCFIHSSRCHRRSDSWRH